MKEDPREPIKIISVISFIWIVLTRILVIFVIDLLKGEAIPYYNIYIGSIAIDLFQFLIWYCWINIGMALFMVVIIHIPFNPDRFKKYFWVICGIVLFIQPIFLTIIGVLLLIYSKDLSIEKKEIMTKSEGL